jgi:hypothetical protein
MFIFRNCWPKFKRKFSTEISVPLPKNYKIIKNIGILLLMSPAIYKTIFRNETSFMFNLETNLHFENPLSVVKLSKTLLEYIQEGQITSILYQNNCVTFFLIKCLSFDDLKLRKNALESIKLLIVNDAFLRKFLWFDFIPNLMKCSSSNEKEVQQIFDLIFKKETNISLMNEYPTLLKSLCHVLKTQKGESLRLSLNSIYFLMTNGK